jgi:hypothetical protein
MVAANIIPFELPLPLNLPTIEGNVDYRDFRAQLLRIDSLLVQSGLETQMIEADLQRWQARQKRVSAKAQQNHQVHARRALRCNIARLLIHEDYRGFAARLADSPLLQYFCAVSEVGRVVVPSKSTLQRYFVWWPEAEVRPVIQKLLVQGAQAPGQLGLAGPLDLENAFLDSTCLCANIHYPVDWVLLRDATRTLMRSVRLIRDQGLKHRMEEPEAFISRINKLCIKMTHQVLAQLPKARQQARQRILQGQLVANEDKILSLYEADVRVIVRKKAGAEVEFGNTLFLAENRQGVILDWELYAERAPADAALLPRSVARMQKAYAPGPKAVAGDRGFDSELNRFGLKKEEIFNAVCPRAPRQLRQRNRSWKFKRLQRRRAQTEGRIGILKNVFLGGRMRCKGFAHRALTVTWTVLVHNLWVLARLPQPEEAQAEPLAA